MLTTVLGIGQLAATCDPEETIKILGLGSCVALIMIDIRNNCIGMSHVALPDSAVARDGDNELPGKFADIAVDAMIHAMQGCGAGTNPSTYLVKLVGGANFSGLADVFNIGKRNVLALKRQLWLRNMGAIREEIGGNQSRCVAIHCQNPHVLIYRPGNEGHLL